MPPTGRPAVSPAGPASQAPPDCAVFIDDRGPNLAPARALGMGTIHFTTGDRLAEQLAALGVAA
jgi:FMN phosphatase YigB (HAD superfamily)